MKNKWSEMSKQEKFLYVASCILGVALVFFAVADITNWLKFADVCWLLVAGVMLVLDCIGHWKNNRKMAYVELGGSVITLTLGILTLFK